VRDLYTQPESGIGGSFFLKMRGCIPSDGYFLNAVAYSGQAEESLLHRPPSPCFDSRKPLS
ncbi:hypothetical protein, partial [Bacteroides heparinolyticus]|uniref:hypothetical protein n=1 Tax=Prevotella heparinolytica TaxID=28113 RepID=UPI0035A161CE